MFGGGLCWFFGTFPLFGSSSLGVPSISILFRDPDLSRKPAETQDPVFGKNGDCLIMTQGATLVISCLARFCLNVVCKFKPFNEFRVDPR